MPKAYSIDLRQKIVDAYDRGCISQRNLAQQFGVDKSFVQKLLKQRRETGSIVPKARGGQTSPKLNQEHRAILVELVEANKDELSQNYASKYINELVSEWELQRFITP